MKVILLPPSDRELEDAIDFYNDQMASLGGRFYNSFLDTTDYLSHAPAAWKKVGNNTRRINIKRFPYLILYVIDNQDILITCIAHQHRDPTYYADRIY